MAPPHAARPAPPQEPAAADEIASALATLDALAVEAEHAFTFIRSALRLGQQVLEPTWSGLLREFDAEFPVVANEIPANPSLRPSREGLREIAEWAGDETDAGTASLLPLKRGDCLVVRVRRAERVASLLAFSFHRGVPAESRSGLIRFGERLAAAGRRAESNSAMRRVAAGESSWLRYQEVARAANCDAPLPELATGLVDAGASYTGCGRVSLTTQRGRRQKVIAVSGLERFACRSEAIRALEGLSSAAAKLGSPCFYSSDSEEPPPQLEQWLHAYIDLSGAKSLAIFPVSRQGLSGSRRGVLGTLVFERFEEPGVDEAADELVRFTQLAQVSLERAVRLRSVPGLNQLLMLGHQGRWFSRGWFRTWGLALVAVCAAAAALILIKGDLTIDARGELAPQDFQHVFAPHDGVIEAVHVEHGEQVAAESPFLTIVSADLSLRIETVLGEIEVAREELDQTKTAALAETGGLTSLERSRELSARESLLTLRLRHLNKQLKLLQGQASELRVASPRDGSVVTWDIKRDLVARPVRRGDIIGSVADLDGEWRLHLRVPDRLVGHVLASRDEQGTLPSMDFILATNPETTYQAVGVRISPSSQYDPDQGESFVLLEADFKGDPPLDPRFGAAVKARLQCGEGPLYYVWFHEAYEALRRYFF